MFDLGVKINAAAVHEKSLEEFKGYHGSMVFTRESVAIPPVCAVDSLDFIEDIDDIVEAEAPHVPRSEVKVAVARALGESLQTLVTLDSEYDLN